MYLGVAQLGSVLEWGSRGREFKSLHPDQNVGRFILPTFFYAIFHLDIYPAENDGHHGYNYIPRDNYIKFYINRK